MRIPHLTDNGHVLKIDQHMILSHRNQVNNRNNSNNANAESSLYNDINRSDRLIYNDNNVPIYETRNITEDDDNISNQLTALIENLQHGSDSNVCNVRYRIGSHNNTYVLASSDTEKVKEEAVTQSFITSTESFEKNNDASSNCSPIEEERSFNHTDCTENLGKSQLVPRGIINPNYPGFQHLAHTLEDYSSNIDNFYHSENEMTDDDIELSDSICDRVYNENESCAEPKCAKDNNNDGTMVNTNLLSSYPSHQEIKDSNSDTDIPDLLKTITENNNNAKTLDYGIECSDTDIENNFNTSDIIGDFNKEIEDEIKQLLNYNINIQDDLKELRQDIKNTFAKPIENTINNISEVVNHVIKKLVETHSDNANERFASDKDIITNSRLNNYIDNKMPIEAFKTTEFKFSRPTFLLLENNKNSNIIDAFLSDGKEELNVSECDYNTETVRNNVENTIKQLSTELRKIIPKLDKMRECDKLWSRPSPSSVLTDKNLNELAGSSKYNESVIPMSNARIRKTTSFGEYDNLKTVSKIAQIETGVVRDKQDVSCVKVCSSNDQVNSSVHRDSSVEEYDLGSFDVYNIETALPKLDLDTIENHIKAAKEAERRKRNDREEIRKRLAMGADSEEYYSMGHIDRPGRKPSLHSRLQSGKNLQICFMNETASDNESQSSDIDKTINCSKSLAQPNIFNKSYGNLSSHPYQTRPLSVNITKHDKVTCIQSGGKLRPTSLIVKPTKSKSSHSLGHIELKESDFYALQATLQTEARIALAQAKEMARIQMERERRKRPISPVTEMLQHSMEKANVPLPPDRRRVSRQLLTDMNIAQLQVIVNELHSQIESLNEQLVKLLMARDELHMGQDSMLVDIEDLTRYLGVKEHSKKTKGAIKSGVKRFTTIVNK